MIAGYYNIGKALAHLSFAALARREVEGIEAVPPRGPLIVVSNHLSNFDAALLMTSLLGDCISWAKAACSPISCLVSFLLT